MGETNSAFSISSGLRLPGTVGMLCITINVHSCICKILSLHFVRIITSQSPSISALCISGLHHPLQPLLEIP